VVEDILSLTDPTIADKIRALPNNVKMISGCIALLILICAALFGIDRYDHYRSQRAIDKARANVNAALADVNVAKQVVANDRVNEAVAVEQVKQAANDVLAASNASEAAKTETNKALANYAASVNANVQGTTANDLQRKLDALDQ
jgi:hypothetical protein